VYERGFGSRAIGGDAMILEQVSGLTDFVMTNHFVQTAQTQSGSLEQIEAMIEGPLRFPPGSKWGYSNTNYVALGRVIEITSDDQANVSEMATGYWKGVSGRDPFAPTPSADDAWFRGRWRHHFDKRHGRKDGARYIQSHIDIPVT
jgi:hypothetical protein